MMRFLLVMAFLCVSCGPHAIADTGLSKSCTTDAECVAVYVGDACGDCACANSAIATSDLTRYQSEANAATAQCGPFKARACPCAAFPVVCSAGTCGGAR